MNDFYWKTILKGIVCSIFLMMVSCADLVEEDTSTSGCENALNSRDYDNAISKCTSRKEKAAAYMGKAGYDVINILASTSASANTDSNATSVLGTESVSFLTILNILKLSENDISSVSERKAAMETSKLLMEQAIDEFAGATDQTVEEIILETFSSMFATILELEFLLDVGSATTLKISDSDLLTTLASSSGHVITVDSSIPASSVSQSTLADGTSVGTVMKKLDGRIWANEQNLALFLGSITLSNSAQAILGTTEDTLELYGNIDAVCRSFTGSKTSSDSPGKDVVTLIALLSTAVTKFTNALSNTDSESATLVTDVDSNVTTIKSSMSVACSAKDILSEL